MSIKGGRSGRRARSQEILAAAVCSVSAPLILTGVRGGAESLGPHFIEEEPRLRDWLTFPGQSEAGQASATPGLSALDRQPGKRALPQLGESKAEGTVFKAPRCALRHRMQQPPGEGSKGETEAQKGQPSQACATVPLGLDL